MKKNLFAVVLLITFFWSCGGGSKNDTQPAPAFTSEITGITIDKSTIDVSAFEQVTVTLDVASDATVSNVDYRMASQGGGTGWPYERKNVVPVSNQFFIDTNAYIPNKTWRIDEIEITTSNYIYRYYTCNSQANYCMEVTDLSGNTVTDSGYDSQNSGIAVPTYTVTGGTTDSTGPALNSVTVSGTGTGTGGKYKSGDSITISVDAADVESGMAAGFGVAASLVPFSYHSALKYPQQSAGVFTYNSSTDRYEATVTLNSEHDAYPVDLYVALTLSDVAGNQTTLEYNDAVSTVNYSDPADSGIAIVSVPFEAVWPPSATVLTKGNSSTFNDFTISQDQTIVYRYTVTSGTPYGFHAASLNYNGGGGIYTAGDLTFSLYYANGDIVEDNTNNELDAINANYYISPVGFTPDRTGDIYVISHCHGNAGNVGHMIYE